MQLGVGLVQVGGQAEPQLVKRWPSTGHPAVQRIKEKYIFKQKLKPLDACVVCRSKMVPIFLGNGQVLAIHVLLVYTF